MAHKTSFTHADETPVAFRRDNPKVPGLQAHRAYSGYHEATTVGEARKRGATTRNLVHDLRRGYLRLNPRKSPDGSERGSVAGAARKRIRSRAPERSLPLAMPQLAMQKAGAETQATVVKDDRCSGRRHH